MNTISQTNSANTGKSANISVSALQKATNATPKQSTPLTASIDKRQDSINFSIEGLLASEGYNKHGIKAEQCTNGTYNLSFKNTAFLYGAAIRGSVEIDGKEYTIDDNAKRSLRKIADHISALQEKNISIAAARHDANVYVQQYETMAKQQKKDIQAQNIATRMTKGNIVSPKEESLLLKSDPQLYLMAKLAQHMAEMHKKDERILKEEKSENQEITDSPLNHLPEYIPEVNVSIEGESVTANSVSFETIEH